MKATIGILDKSASFRGVMREKLMKLADKYELEMIISTFETLEEMDRDELAFDLLLMDTDFEGDVGDGIKWVKKQKLTGRYANLVYVSEWEERVFEAMLTDPIAFVRKSNLEADLDKAIGRFKEEITSLPAFVVVPEGRKRYIFFPKDVMYFFSCGHYIEVTSPEGEIKVIRGKLSELEKLFRRHGFLRVHTRYLINLRYIAHVEKKKIAFVNKTTCYASEKFRDQAYKTLGLYKFEGLNDEGAV